MTEGVGLPLICLHQARIEGNPEKHPAGGAVVRAGTEEGVPCRDHVLGRFGGGEHGIGGGLHSVYQLSRSVPEMRRAVAMHSPTSAPPAGAVPTARSSLSVEQFVLENQSRGH